MTQTYYGTKKIIAETMTRQAYNDYRGWELPSDEDGSDSGYLVEYVDGGEANHPDHAGYISWSPSSVFDASYQASGKMNFGHAIQAMKDGRQVGRAGWNGKGMFVFLTEGRVVPNTKDRSFAHFSGDEVVLASHIDMRAADGSFVTGWLANQTDMLADDWAIVEPS